MGAILNLPWLFVGVILAVCSMPTNIRVHRNPFAIIFKVRSFWWQTWMISRKGVRACAVGSVVLVGQQLLPHDEDHELIHVRQSMRYPLIYPFLYAYQSLRYGHRQNKFECEAYDTAGNAFLEK